MGTYDNPEVVDEGREIDGGATLMALNSSEINQQISTAKKYPRSLKEFIREATEMATLSQEIAAECMYSLKRKEAGGGSKIIEGPSARFAEIVLSAWGNCRAGARVIGEDDRFVTSQGAFMDLQRNVAITYEVRRRITTSKGAKFGDDMVGVTANAACSIALRNAVFKGIPKAFWNDIYLKARQTAIGDAKSLGQRRGDMMAAFSKMGVSKEQVFVYLEVPGEADITLDHIGHLVGVFSALKAGEYTIDDVFNDNGAGGGKAADSKLNDKYGKNKKPEAGTEGTKPAESGSAQGEKPADTTPPAESTGSADAANTDVREGGEVEHTEDPLLPWDARNAEIENLEQADKAIDDLNADKTLNSDQKQKVYGWLLETQRKYKPKKKTPAGSQKELGDG